MHYINSDHLSNFSWILVSSCIITYCSCKGEEKLLNMFFVQYFVWATGNFPFLGAFHISKLFYFYQEYSQDLSKPTCGLWRTAIIYVTIFHSINFVIYKVF